MKLYLLFGLAGMALLYGGWLGYERLISPPQSVALGHRTYILERADTDEERRRGLGNRDTLCEQCAMLFEFDGPGQYAFWMKDMRFPLDIAWLLDTQIVWIERSISPESRASYQPDVLSNRVLELNAGALEGVKVGESVRFLR